MSCVSHQHTTGSLLGSQLVQHFRVYRGHLGAWGEKRGGRMKRTEKEMMDGGEGKVVMVMVGGGGFLGGVRVEGK